MFLFRFTLFLYFILFFTPSAFHISMEVLVFHISVFLCLFWCWIHYLLFTRNLRRLLLLSFSLLLSLQVQVQVRAWGVFFISYYLKSLFFSFPISFIFNFTILLSSHHHHHCDNNLQTLVLRITCVAFEDDGTSEVSCWLSQHTH